MLWVTLQHSKALLPWQPECPGWILPPCRIAFQRCRNINAKLQQLSNRQAPLGSTQHDPSGIRSPPSKSVPLHATSRNAINPPWRNGISIWGPSVPPSRHLKQTNVESLLLQALAVPQEKYDLFFGAESEIMWGYMRHHEATDCWCNLVKLNQFCRSLLVASLKQTVRFVHNSHLTVILSRGGYREWRFSTADHMKGTSNRTNLAIHWVYGMP